MKFRIWVFLENLSGKFKFHYNLTKVASTLRESQYKVLIRRHSVHVRIRNDPGKCRRGNQNTYLCLIIFFSRKSCLLYGSPQVTIWRRRIAFCIFKATNTHSECIILTAFQCNNGCTKAPQCHAIRILTLLFFYCIRCCRVLLYCVEWFGERLVMNVAWFGGEVWLTDGCAIVTCLWSDRRKPGTPAM